MENEDLILRLNDKEFTFKLLDNLLYNEYKEKFGHNIKTLKDDLNNDIVFKQSFSKNERIDILFISINNIQKNYSLRLEKISYIRKKINNK